MVRKTRWLLITFVIFFFAIATNAYAADQKIFDDADLFTDTEEAEMQEAVDLLSEQFQIDIVIVTTDDNQGKTSKEYADGFYDEGGFGYGDTVDGVLYLINMDDREVYISTTGRVIDIFESEIEPILDVVYPYLADDNFSQSVFAFLDEVESIMYDGLTVMEILLYIVISLAVGGIVVGIMARYNRGQLTVNADTYLERDTFKVTRKSDKHYNTIVTQRTIEKSSSSSSGGGSGSSHGGGGRSF